MPTDYREQLCEAFAEVLEKMAFLFCDEADKDELPSDSRSHLMVKISFRGPVVGTLMVTVPHEVCSDLAINVMGLDDDEQVDDEQARDALKELANVTCGHMLTAIAGSEPVFDLTVPQIVEIDESEWKRVLAHKDSLAFLIDENPVLMRLRIDEAPGQAKPSAA